MSGKKVRKYSTFKKKDFAHEWKTGFIEPLAYVLDYIAMLFDDNWFA